MYNDYSTVFFNEDILNIIDSYLKGTGYTIRVVTVLLYQNQFTGVLDFDYDQYKLQFAHNNLKYNQFNVK
jgi:hypothetical protein